MELPDLPTECPECGDPDYVMEMWVLVADQTRRQPEWWCWECAVEDMIGVKTRGGRRNNMAGMLRQRRTPRVPPDRKRPPGQGNRPQ